MVISLLVGAEPEKAQNLCIPGITLDSKLTLENHLREVVSKAARSLGSCAEQESYFIVHVCSRAVSMRMFCPAWSIVPRVNVVSWISFVFAG